MKTRHAVLSEVLSAVASGLVLLLLSVTVSPAQTLLNVDFGVGNASAKRGPAATGVGTNDFWNLYRHYDPKFTPGMPLVSEGRLDNLKLADGSDSTISLAVTNAPGVWGNSSGDPMYDTYIFSQNGSNITVTLTGLAPGRYHFYLYGHADADASGEQNSAFTLKSGTNVFGPLSATGGNGWKVAAVWQERAQYVVFRDVPVERSPVVLDVAAGPNGIAVLNGLQVVSRGTGAPRLWAPVLPEPEPASTNLVFRDLQYDGRVSDTEARFIVAFDVESRTTNELSATLFEGDVALTNMKLPAGLRLVARNRQTRLFCAVPGLHHVELELLARITRAEPWNQIAFTGPPVAIASVSATAAAPGIEIQLLSGTPLETEPQAASHIRGLLGVDRTLSLRWQGKTAEVSRKSLITADTVATAQITPTVIKYNTSVRYQILQAATPRLTVELPVAHALTRIQGEQIRDWRVETSGDRQVLVIDFIKPVETAYALTVFSEQAVPAAQPTTLVPPQPLEVEHESGSFTLSADDTTVETETTPGLRQVNPPAGALSSYRFSGRPIAVTARLQRIQPVLKVADRATVRLEESRLVVAHALNLTVEKAGIYSLELAAPAGFVASEVRGEGIDDWKFTEGKLSLSFTNRVLGLRKLDVSLERSFQEFPESITVLPLTVSGATNVTTQLGAAASPGIRLKTAGVSGLREIPIGSLPNRADEALAFAGEMADWRLTLGAERLASRIVAEVFNLVTVGDGLVGGSATIRYGILLQGVQQFRVAVPAHWKNLEFTGANIRRKEQQTNVWTITLQDKAWGAYTLVITYDYSFDPKGGTLNLAGAHALGVERETGSLGVMTAASLKLTPANTAEPLHRVDEAELAEHDRALCTRPLVLAYKYAGGDYQHSLAVTRFDEVKVLDAVADRTELTTVMTEAGQLLTQSSFMVKNTEKQFQKFKLPKDAEFWSSFVNGQPAKAEKDGDWLLVPLPRDVSRDQAFAVDIVYAQTNDLGSSLFSRRFVLAAPLTDIPNTYAEWQLFVPVTQRLSGFGGNMTVASGTTYEWRDAWQAFVQFYGNLIERNGGVLVLGIVVLLIGVLLWSARRRGAQGVVTAITIIAVLAILGAMMLPALSKAKAKAQRINAMNNLKQIGLALKTWSLDNGDALPASLDALKAELGTDRVTVDPNTGQPFIYVGAGKSEADPQAIVAYSPSDVNGRAVLLADGSVQVLSPERFQAALQRDAIAAQTATFNAPVSAPMSQAQPMPQSPSRMPGQRQAQTFGLVTNSMAAPEAMRRLARGPGAVADQPAQISGPFGGGGAGGGGALGGAVAQHRVAGVRPIRIEVPRTGQAFSFTKVLNANNEALSIRAFTIRLKVYRAEQMVLQVAGFLTGLVLLGWLARRPAPSSLGLTIATSLVLWSVSRLLAMWRLLHVGLIVAVPALTLVLLGWIGWRAWRRFKAAREAVEPTEPLAATTPESPLPGAGAAALILLLTSAAGSAAAQVPGSAGVSNAVSILSADYSGSVTNTVARFDAAIQIATTATNQFVPLFGVDVAIQSFSAPDDNRLELDGNVVGVRLPKSGTIRCQIKLVARLGGDITRRKLAFAIPPALASRFTLAIDELDADIEFPTAVAVERVVTNQQTRVQAVLGATDRLELNWTPRVKRAAEIAATVFVQSSAMVAIGGGVVNTRAALDYQVSQGELKQARLRIPAGQRLLRVEGDSIRTWEVTGDVLLVELVKGVSPAYKLQVETEAPLGKLPAAAKVEIPRALEVQRETGLVAVRGTEEIALTIESADELQRVDAEEFHRAAPGMADGVANAFRFLRPGFALTVRAEAIEARLEAVARHSLRISPESVRLLAKLDYAIKGAGIFALRVVLPPSYRLEDVSGPNLSQWVERLDGATRVLEVTLKERTLGNYALSVSLIRNYAEPPASLAIPFVHPLDTRKLSGFITVTAEQGVAAKTESLEGLTEIPLASVPGEAATASAGALAYKFISTAPGAGPGWKLNVGLEAVEPWVRAEIMNTLTVGETLVSGRSLVKYSVANAPVREFRLRVPTVFKNVELNGSQIRRRDETNGEWRVELQGKVRGDYVLTVTWELPRPAGTTLELDGVQALGVERESGFVAVVARPPLQVTDHSRAELLSRIDGRELPEWPGAADAATVLVYRYPRPGYRLALEVQRFEQAEVLQALIDSARLSTVVAEDGQMMTEVSLNVRNNGRQHLEIQLPPRAFVWSSFVSGQAVRPSTNNGRLLIPLARDVASDAATVVELTYVGAAPFPESQGRFALASPTFDMPLKNAHWDLYLPPDYEYSKFDGSMSRAGDAGVPVIQAFSISEYNVQQQAQEAQQKSDLQADLQAARANLGNNNLRQAMSSFNRSKSRNQNFKVAADEDRDLKAVEQELRRAQGSNLILAQNAYYANNNEGLVLNVDNGQQVLAANAAQNPSFQNSPAPNLFLNYDAEIAGQQWEKLEKAQQVAVAKVAPLRINLPTRGIRYSFSQVLQTELHKSMTIGLLAENGKVPNWTTRFGFGLLGFLILWAGFAFLVPHKTSLR